MTTRPARQESLPTPLEGADPEVTSRLTTDGTKYLPETYESTDGTQEIPHPMIDPMGARRKRQTDWPIGDARRHDADFEP